MIVIILGGIKVIAGLKTISRVAVDLPPKAPKSGFAFIDACDRYAARLLCDREPAAAVAPSPTSLEPCRWRAAIGLRGRVTGQCERSHHKSD